MGGKKVYLAMDGKKVVVDDDDDDNDDIFNNTNIPINIKPFIY